jgi:hypothetical protein
MNRILLSTLYAVSMLCFGILTVFDIPGLWKLIPTFGGFFLFGFLWGVHDTAAKVKRDDEEQWKQDLEDAFIRGREAEKEAKKKK